MGELLMWLGSSIDVGIAGEDVLMHTGEHSAVVDHLLVATGRTPNTTALNLAAAGVSLDASGRPSIDPITMRASDTPIFFAGDVQPDRPLLPASAGAGRMAAQAVLSSLSGGPWQGVSGSVPTSILVTDPDI